jgi:hypothetical protein
MKLNHIPISSTSGTCLISSVVECWTLKLEPEVPDEGTSLLYIVIGAQQTTHNNSLSPFIICQPLYLICCLFMILWG